jgi:predicted Rdx family selenoprotein
MVEGGFPELKVLVCRIHDFHGSITSILTSVPLLSHAQKQRIRDHLQPGKSLGHSDTSGAKVV